MVGNLSIQPSYNNTNYNPQLSHNESSSTTMNGIYRRDVPRNYELVKDLRQDSQYPVQYMHSVGPNDRNRYHMGNTIQDQNSNVQVSPTYHILPPHSSGYNDNQVFHHYNDINAPYHSNTKQPNGGTNSEDFVADPLPFEYGGTRKTHNGTKEDSRSNIHYQEPYTNYSHPGIYDHEQKPVNLRSDYHIQQNTTFTNHPSSRMPYNSHIASNFRQGNARPGQLPPQTYEHQMIYHPNTNVLPSVNGNTGYPQSYQSQAISNVKKEIAHQYPVVDFVDKQNTMMNQGQPINRLQPTQEAMIKVKTPLKHKYYRNGRRNLQCFPSCKVYGDYSQIKIEDLKQHDFMWGKCRGSVITEVTLNSTISFDDLIVLGRVHSLDNISAVFDEAVIRECMLGRLVEPEAMESMKEQWIIGERLPDFVHHVANTACFEFKPKVWKYTEDMGQGKCKRRNVKYYVQFEAFISIVSNDRRVYACVGSGMSTSFEVGSSRVLARQKRRAANPVVPMSGEHEEREGEQHATTRSASDSNQMHPYNSNSYMSRSISNSSIQDTGENDEYPNKDSLAAKKRKSPNATENSSTYRPVKTSRMDDVNSDVSE